jgi:hypothetical protein
MIKDNQEDKQPDNTMNNTNSTQSEGTNEPNTKNRSPFMIIIGFIITMILIGFTLLTLKARFYKPNNRRTKKEVTRINSNKNK